MMPLGKKLSLEVRSLASEQGKGGNGGASDGYVSVERERGGLGEL